MAELHELPRLFSLARKATQRYGNASAWAKAKKHVQQYTLGTGHVIFFVPRIKYLAQRYAELCADWRSRGYSVTQIPEEELLQGIDSSFMNDYTPTQDAMMINRERIALRLSEMAAKAAVRKEKKYVSSSGELRSTPFGK